MTEQLDQARKEGMQFEAEFKIEKEQMEALHIATVQSLKDEHQKKIEEYASLLEQ